MDCGAQAPRADGIAPASATSPNCENPVGMGAPFP